MPFAVTGSTIRVRTCSRTSWKAGALIRIYFVARHAGRASPLPIIIAVLILLGLAFALVPASRATSVTAVSLETVRPVIESRCTNCHSDSPSHIAFPAAPSGVVLDTDQQIEAEADRIHQQTVVLKAMPIGNLTMMSDEERALIDAWYLGRDE